MKMLRNSEELAQSVQDVNRLIDIIKYIEGLPTEGSYHTADEKVVTLKMLNDQLDMEGRWLETLLYRSNN